MQLNNDQSNVCSSLSTYFISCKEKKYFNILALVKKELYLCI